MSPNKKPCARSSVYEGRTLRRYRMPTWPRGISCTPVACRSPLRSGRFVGHHRGINAAIKRARCLACNIAGLEQLQSGELSRVRHVNRVKRLKACVVASQTQLSRYTFSFRSCCSCASRVRVAIGLASSLLSEIGFPVARQ